MKLRNKILLGSTISLISGLIVFNAINPEINVKDGAGLELTHHNDQLLYSDLDITLTPSDSKVAPLPNSLSDLDISFPLLADETGNLIVNDGLVELIEWYLSSLGEISIDQIVAHIHQAFSDTLPISAQAQAKAFLSQYLSYKSELKNLQDYLNEVSENLTPLEQIALKKEKLKSLRVTYFSNFDYESLFTQADQYDDFLARHLTIAQDESLTMDERLELQKQNEQNLPATLKEIRHNSMQYTDSNLQVQMLREDGADEQAIYEYRAEKLGEEAAQSLAELDEIRENWQNRVDQFISNKELVMSSGLSDEDQAQELTRILNRDFSEIEVVRVRAVTQTY